MPVRHCPRCEEWVSEEAKTCPECGALLTESPAETHDEPRDARSSVWFGLLVCLPLLVLGGASFPVTMGLLFATGVPVVAIALLTMWYLRSHERHSH